MARPKARWSPTPPDNDGWYWIKYRDKNGNRPTTPASVFWLGHQAFIRGARGGSWLYARGGRWRSPRFRDEPVQALDDGRKEDKSISFWTSPIREPRPTKKPKKPKPRKKAAK